jgi:hypothetical protein
VSCSFAPDVSDRRYCGKHASKCRASFEAVIAITGTKIRTAVQVMPLGKPRTDSSPVLGVRFWRPSSFDFQDAKIWQLSPRIVAVFFHPGAISGCDFLKPRPKGSLYLLHIIPEFLPLETGH